MAAAVVVLDEDEEEEEEEEEEVEGFLRRPTVTADGPPPTSLD